MMRLKGKRPTELTPREKEVLALIADGYTNAEAARVLRVTADTVGTLRIRIKNRLQITTFAELVKYAVSNGYVSVEKEPRYMRFK